MNTSPHTPRQPSAYMGAPVEIRTGPNGEIARAELIHHGEQFTRQVHRVRDGVFCHVGSCLGNSTLIEGKTGNIIVDTGDCIQQSQEQQEDFKKVSDRELSALIYTHSHYALGSRTWVSAERQGQIPVWGHRDLLKVMSRTVGDLYPFMIQRVCMQFGLYLPEHGPDAMPNEGLGPFFFPLSRYTPTGGFVPPNHAIDDGQEAEIDGVRFQFFHTPSDSDDTILIWLPEHRVAINNLAWPVMFNIYTLRGEMFRNPLALLPGIDRMIALRPEHLVGVHGVPISGEAAIQQALTEYRDCIQFTYDQTVRGINMGLSPDELVDFVQLPPALAHGRLTGQFYGELSFYVRQIYCGLVGWFGNDTVELHPVRKADEAQRLIDLAGGRERMLAQAQTALQAREFSWAAQLATYLVRTDASDAAARQLKADALRAMGQITTAANTRSWYLTQARALEGQVDTRKVPVNLVNPQMVRSLPPLAYVNALRFKLDPALSAHGSKRVRFTLSVSPEQVLSQDLVLRHGVVTLEAPVTASGDASISLNMDEWSQLVGGGKTLEALLAQGITLEGDQELAMTILRCAAP